MPESITLTVSGLDLKVGDVINTDEVQKIDRKVKWMTVTFTTGATRDLLIDSEVTVTRERETESEKEARFNQYKANFLQRNAYSARATYDTAVSKQIEDLSNGYRLSYSTLSDLAAAEATLEIATQMIKTVDYRRQQGDDEVTAWLTAGDLVRESTLEKILSHARSGENRSSSQMSNVLEDIKISVYAKFVDDFKWL